MSFLMPSAPAAPPPPPPSITAPAVLTAQSAASQAAAAAAGGMGFNGTVKTSAQGAPDADTAQKRLLPAVAGTKQVFG